MFQLRRGRQSGELYHEAGAAVVYRGSALSRQEIQYRDRGARDDRRGATGGERSREYAGGQ